MQTCFVAIPFSSGQYSFGGRDEESRSMPRRNPFFIRSVFVPHLTLIDYDSVESQSLFHQVCVRSRRIHRGRWSRHHVAIPFSSGQYSFRAGPTRSRSTVQSRNPFFIRSVFVQRRQMYESYNECKVAIPFSSGLCSFDMEENGG